MGIFYFDRTLLAFEERFQWDSALEYIEELYLEGKDTRVLYSLIGFSWFYLIEGPCVSRMYENDPNCMALDCWKKYIDIGEQQAYGDAFFNFIAGYTLSLHGLYINEEYEKKGNLFIKRCLSISDDVLLQQLAKNFLMNEHSKKHIPVENGKTICEHLFNDRSLLDGYFNEIYAS